MRARVDFLAHLAVESGRFLEAVSAARPDAPVPTCPNWTADDLLWHLGEVQWFWATIVRDFLDAPDRAQELKPERPANRSGLQSFYSSASRALQEALIATSSATPVWTWSEDRTVGFVARRQAHEALIHRIDAELTAGTHSSIDMALAADGVDEVLRVMYGSPRPLGGVDSDEHATVRLRAVDTEDSWLVTMGRFNGTDPDTGTAYDEPTLLVSDVDPPDTPASAELQANASDIDCWLWRRPRHREVRRSGDPQTLARFENIIQSGIQ